MVTIVGAEEAEQRARQRAPDQPIVRVRRARCAVRRVGAPLLGIVIRERARLGQPPPGQASEVEGIDLVAAVVAGATAATVEMPRAAVEGGARPGRDHGLGAATNPGIVPPDQHLAHRGVGDLIPLPRGHARRYIRRQYAGGGGFAGLAGESRRAEQPQAEREPWRAEPPDATTLGRPCQLDHAIASALGRCGR